MSELQSAIDALTAALADLDETTLSAAEAHEQVPVLLRLRNQVDAGLTRTVRRAELVEVPEVDGLKSMPSWLRGHGHLSEAEAQQIVRTGRALEHLPVVAAAFADGTVTAGQVAVIAQVARPDRVTTAAEAGIDLGEIDATLAATAIRAEHATVKLAVGHYLACLDTDGPEPDPTEGRRLTVARHLDGSFSGGFGLDGVGGEKLLTALESMVQAGRAKGDTRTRAQQLADALVQLADNQLASGNLPTLRTVKPHVIVTIGLEDARDPATGPGAARTGFGASLSAARARWVACDATITRMITDPDGLPLDVGRTQRVVPPHIRRAVEQRDRHCVFAGCSNPTHWCDVHHLLEWVADQGETSLENSALLCERHHTKVHHGFRVDRDDGGRWHTHRPDGTEILIGPPLPV